MTIQYQCHHDDGSISVIQLKSNHDAVLNIECDLMGIINQRVIAEHMSDYLGVDVEVNIDSKTVNITYLHDYDTCKAIHNLVCAYYRMLGLFEVHLLQEVYHKLWSVSSDAEEPIDLFGDLEV